MRILVHYPFAAEQVDELRAIAAGDGHELKFAEDEDEAADLVADCECLLGFFSEKVTAAAPQLRWIQSFSAGMDNFLYAEIIDREQVEVSNTAGLFAPQGGEHVWALLLALTRGLLPFIRQMPERKWAGGQVIELTGMTLGLIGLGGFGRETAKRARGYDMRIIGLDPVRQAPMEDIDEIRTPEPSNMDWLLSCSDAVVIGCPRTPQTYHLIGAKQLAQMKETAYLICVSRGGIIDEGALIQALHDGQLAGAGLDVSEQEPLPADHPLWEAPNLILTPHRAGASQHRPRKIHEFFCDNLRRYLRGESPLNIVDKARGF
jgi:phosphoglycerate dehydrogenase-like enzyme